MRSRLRTAIARAARLPGPGPGPDGARRAGRAVFTWMQVRNTGALGRPCRFPVPLNAGDLCGWTVAALPRIGSKR